MAFRAIDVESLLAAVEHLRRDRKRKAVAVSAIDLAGVHERIVRQLAASDGARNAWPRRHAVGKEIARLQRIVFRLASHRLEGRTRALAGEWQQEEAAKRRQLTVATVNRQPSTTGPRSPRGD